MKIKQSRNGRIAAMTLVLLTLVGGGYFLTRRPDPLAEVPNDASLRAPWACRSCGQVTWLTPRDRVRLELKNSRQAVGGQEGGPSAEGEAQTSSRELFLHCESCGKVELRHAFVCPVCDTPFAGVVHGKIQTCPVCRWDPRKAKEQLPGEP